MKRAYVTLLASAADSPGVGGARSLAPCQRDTRAAPGDGHSRRAAAGARKAPIEGSRVRDIDFLGPSEHDGPSPLSRARRRSRRCWAWQRPSSTPSSSLLPTRWSSGTWQGPSCSSGPSRAPSFAHRPDQLDSGVMVLTPSEGTFEGMLRAVEALGTLEDRSLHPANAQELLNQLLGWREASPEHHLPKEYNLSVRHYPIAQPPTGIPRVRRRARPGSCGTAAAGRGRACRTSSALRASGGTPTTPRTRRRTGAGGGESTPRRTGFMDRLCSHSPDQEPNSARPGG